MTGPYDAVLGMKTEQVLRRFTTQLPTRFEVPDEGRKILSGCFIEIDDVTGKAKKIEPLMINEDRPFGLDH